MVKPTRSYTLPVVLLEFCLLGHAQSFRSSVTSAFIGCDPSTAQTINNETQQPLSACQATVPTGWMLADLSPARRGSSFVDLYPLAKEARLVLIGKYASKRRLLFDTQVSCSASTWKPCHLFKACQPCLLMASDNWFSDFTSLEVYVEGQATDYCSSQYVLRIEYESYHMFLARESDPRPSSTMSSDPPAGNCPGFGDYFKSMNGRVQMCVMSSRDLLDQNTSNNDNNNNNGDSAFFTPIANCSHFGTVIRMNRRQQISHVGVITADMPLRLVFAVGFVVLISGLYSARRWRTSAGSGATSAAAMIRLSGLWRYPRDPRYRYPGPSYAYHSRPLVISNGGGPAGGHGGNLESGMDQEPELELRTSVSGPPPCYASTLPATHMNNPPPSYDEVVLSASVNDNNDSASK